MDFHKIVVCAYACAALLTFGYSYNADYESAGKNSIVTSEEINASRALVSGAMWPAYWAVSAFQGVRQESRQQ